jgi:hypothetical protein
MTPVKAKCFIGGAAAVSTFYGMNNLYQFFLDPKDTSHFERFLRITQARIVKGRISDSFAAKQHPSLIASLSPPPSSKRTVELMDQRRRDFFEQSPSYLLKVLETVPFRPDNPPIFRLQSLEEMPFLPALKGLVLFAGTPKGLVYDPLAREELYEGTYLRCKRMVKNQNGEDVDVIITGTTDPRDCGRFDRQLDREKFKQPYSSAAAKKANDDEASFEERDSPTPYPVGIHLSPPLVKEKEEDCETP